MKSVPESERFGDAFVVRQERAFIEERLISFSRIGSYSAVSSTTVLRARSVEKISSPTFIR